MNDQTSLQEQLHKTAALADKNGLYDAADWVRRHLLNRPLKYYKSAGLGVVGTTIGHEDGPYTLLQGHTRQYSWIRTSDLHATRGAAEAGSVATFAEQTHGQK